MVKNVKNNIAVPKQAIQYECTTDYDCPSDQACIQRSCSSPCTLEKCARNALCHVQNHNPICRCPQGQTGDPRVECRFPEPRKTPRTRILSSRDSSKFTISKVIIALIALWSHFARVLTYRNLYALRDLANTWFVSILLLYIFVFNCVPFLHDI